MEEIRRKGTNHVSVRSRTHSGTYSINYANVKLLASRHPLPGWLREELERRINPPDMDMSGYAFKTDPWPHQKRGLQEAVRKRKILLFYEPGTGKTKIGTDLIGYLFLSGNAQRALIVAPLSVLPTWEREWAAHSTCGRIVRPSSVKALKELVGEWPDKTVILTNYEKINPCVKLLCSSAPEIVVADELTKVKSFRALRTKALSSVTKRSEYVLGLTGTPATNKLLDLLGEYMVVDPFWFGVHIGTFKERYCVMGGWMGSEIIGYKNEDEIREILDHSSLTALKKDVLELPDKVYLERIIELEKDQRKLYRKVSNQFLVEMQKETVVDIKSAVARITKLQEIAGGFIFAEEYKVKDGSAGLTGKKKPVRVGKAKVRALIEVLDEIPGDSPVVIWCRFIEEMRMIREEISLSRPVYELHGSMTANEREDAENSFKKAAPDGAVWIIQIQTGGLGLQLEYVSHVVFYSNSFEALYRFQAEDRCHRPGQKNPVTYYDLIADMTVDEKLLKILKSKKNLNDWILERRGSLLELFKS